MGLISQALDRAPRWAIKKLTATYLTLGLSEIGRAVKIESEDEVRAVIFSMVRSISLRSIFLLTRHVSRSNPTRSAPKFPQMGP